MYLKSLEIQGFKSFADKVEFQFTPGVSAIVGPNGSGKSNVVDSIRWVLGEQSAKSLRGSKMDDIIFSGSSKRRAVGMAQVTLTLDNSDGKFPFEQSEVAITRRLYRSGESEYMINKSSCRLKDIHELFLDTGVGREGFSVIGQGKVDEVLSLKAEDRRGLIEEAAGIMKYKYRKKDAERRLEETTGNMERLNDIVYELSERLGPLGEQAEKAKSYYVWKNEMDTLALSLDIGEMTAAMEKKAELETALKNSQDRFLAAETAVNSLDSANIARKQRLQEQEEAYMAANDATFSRQKQSEEYLNEEKILTQQREQIIVRLEQIKEEQIYLSEEKDRLKTSLAEKTKEKQALEEQWSSLSAYLTSLTAQEEKTAAALQAKRQDGEEQNNAYLDLLQKQAGKNNRRSALEQNISQLKQRIKRSEEKAARLEDELAQSRANYEQNTALLAENQQKQQEMVQKIAEMDGVLQKNRQQYAQALDDEKNAQSLWQKQNSRLNALEELEEGGDGYQYGVKSILEAKRDQKLKGIIGTVAQVIKVPQRLEKAVEVALGGSLQNIITVNDKDAQKAIGYLKQQKKGRATFMPLNTVSGQRSKESLNEQGVLGLACDLLEYDPQYANIMLNLLGRVWIVDTLAHAVEIGKQHKFGVRLVTLDGEVIAPGGSLSGGSFSDKKSGILLRLRQIEELKKETALLENSWQQTAAKMNALQEKLKELNEENVRLNSQNEEYLRAAITYKNDIAAAAKELDRLRSEQEFELFEADEARNELHSNADELEQIEGELQLIAARSASWNENEAQRREDIRILEQELTVWQEKRHSEEIKLAQHKERLQALKEQQRETERQFAAYESQFAAKTDEQSEKEQELERLRTNLLDIKEKMAQAEEDLRLARQKQELLRQSRDELRQLIEKNEEELRQKQRQAQELQGEKFQTELEFNKVKNRLDSLEQNLAENYECSYAEGLLRRVEIEDEPAARKNVAKLKSRINALGNINFAAIEEYAEVQERLEFLHGQLADLTEAKESLDKVIKEMEQIMAKKFRETYVVVNNMFSEVFATMFCGGEARLQLSDPNDYLRTGVEIIARPPGKKEQTLSLLSGGERAMTAIALLFALLNVRPSPFCVLDEIEAALDEVNVERFARFIKEYTRKSQFIVVSHRKGTMEAADVLYGVSMENDGVSKLVSVRLDDYE